MRVLFISGIDGFCLRYQVLHRAAQLTVLGARTTIRHFRDPRLLDDVTQHDLLIAYRVPETAQIRAALALAGDLGIPRIASIDDLIFVDDPRCLPDLDHLPEAERELWREGVRRYRATIERCDVLLAPTEPLVRIADGLGLRAVLHRNSVSPAELELGRRARAAAARGERAQPVLGYFSGTPSHDDDLASIARALRDVLAGEPGARLLLVGPVRLPDELASVADRVDRRPLVPWHELPSLVASVDVCLAPLLAEHPFAAAKGEVKYLEAAAVQVPTVATATEAFRHAIHDGENGFVATTQDEWRRALATLLASRALRERMGEAARADVERRYSEATRACELLGIIQALRAGLSQRRRAAHVRPAPIDAATGERPGRVALEADACPAFASSEPSTVGPPLPPGSRIVQRLRVAHDGLVRVDVHTVTFGQALTGELSLSLSRADGTVVATSVVPADELPDRAWVALELDTAEQRSAGAEYVLELHVGGGPGALTPTFGLMEAPGRGPRQEGGVVGPAELDGRPLAGALALRGFASWAHVLAGATLTPSVSAQRDRGARAAREATGSEAAPA